MEEQVVNLIVGGVVSWTTAFLMLRKSFPKRSFEFCNRTVSTLHATLAVILASLSVQDWMSPISPLASKPSPRQAQALAVTLSYLIYDLGCGLFDDKRVNVDNVIHHLVSITGISAGLVYQKCGSELVAALWITELSSPFLHMRELLKELGYRDTDLNLVADIAFAVIFSIARMVGGPYLTFKTLSADNPFIIKVVAKIKMSTVTVELAPNTLLLLYSWVHLVFGFSGYGTGVAAGQCFLVLQNCQNGEVQAHEENRF